MQVLEVPLIQHEVKHVQDAPHRVRLARPGRTLHEREREIVVAHICVSSVVLRFRGGVRGGALDRRELRRVELPLQERDEFWVGGDLVRERGRRVGFVADVSGPRAHDSTQRRRRTKHRVAHRRVKSPHVVQRLVALRRAAELTRGREEPHAPFRLFRRTQRHLPRFSRKGKRRRRRRYAVTGQVHEVDARVFPRGLPHFSPHALERLQHVALAVPQRFVPRFPAGRVFVHRRVRLRRDEEPELH